MNCKRYDTSYTLRAALYFPVTVYVLKSVGSPSTSRLNKKHIRNMFIFIESSLTIVMPFNRSRIRIGTAEPGRLTIVNIVNSSNKMYRDTVAVASEHLDF